MDKLQKSICSIVSLLSCIDPLTQEAQTFIPFTCLEGPVFYQKYAVQSSHTSHWFVLRRFANWQVWPKNKNTSLRPLSG